MKKEIHLAVVVKRFGLQGKCDLGPARYLFLQYLSSPQSLRIRQMPVGFCYAMPVAYLLLTLINETNP
jgi:hypothetical protein